MIFGKVWAIAHDLKNLFIYQFWALPPKKWEGFKCEYLDIIHCSIFLLPCTLLRVVQGNIMSGSITCTFNS